MVAKLTFSNVAFVQSSTQEVRVALDQTFDIVLEQVAEESESLRWSTIGDAITDVREATTGLSARVKATAVGKGEIQLQSANREVVFWLAIDVYNAAEAVSADARELGDEPRA